MLWITTVFALHLLSPWMPFSLALFKSLKIQILTRTVCLPENTCWWLDLSIFNTVQAQMSFPLQVFPTGPSVGFCVRGRGRNWSLDYTDRLVVPHSSTAPLSHWMADYPGDRPPPLPLVMGLWGSSLSPLSYLTYLMRITPPASQGCWRLEWGK